MDKGKLYSLLKRKDTEELHLFNSNIRKEDKKCFLLENESMCGAMESDERIGNAIFACENEVEARKLCAQKGRAVCGNCVAQLYTTDYL